MQKITCKKYSNFCIAMLGYFRMSEIVTTYQLKDLSQPVPMDRDEFYEEQIALAKAGEKPTRSVAVVQVLLFTPDGEIMLQKRSRSKAHNAGMFDKTLGGHIRFGDSSNYTVLAETLQELSVPSFVLDSKDEFEKTYTLLKGHIRDAAFVYFVDSKTYNSKKMFDETERAIANTYYFYLGVFAGSVKPSEREAAGMLYLKKNLLEEKFESQKDHFTEDLSYFLSKYSKKIDEFVQSL